MIADNNKNECDSMYFSFFPYQQILIIFHRSMWRQMYIVQDSQLQRSLHRQPTAVYRLPARFLPFSREMRCQLPRRNFCLSAR